MARIRSNFRKSCLLIFTYNYFDFGILEVLNILQEPNLDKGSEPSAHVYSKDDYDDEWELVAGGDMNFARKLSS